MDSNEELPPDDEGAVEEESEFSARFARVVRTETSEVYLIWQDETRIGQVDLHYGWDLIHATLLLERDLTAEQQADLVDLLDQDIVTSHLPRFTREDFLVTIFRGQELEPFSDGPDPEDDVEDDDDF